MPTNQIVQVSFLPLSKPFRNNNPDGGYAYIWPFLGPPAVGQRVIVPTDSNESNEAVIVGLGVGSRHVPGDLKRIAKVIRQS